MLATQKGACFLYTVGAQFQLLIRSRYWTSVHSGCTVRVQYVLAVHTRHWDTGLLVGGGAQACLLCRGWHL